MASLQRLGFSVCLAPASMTGGAPAAALEAMGIACYCAPWCASVEEVLRREAGGFALVSVHRGRNARYLPLVRHYQPRALAVYSVSQLHHLGLSRQAAVEQRPELLALSDRVRQAELLAAMRADRVMTHSGFEAALLRQALPRARVHVVPWSVPLRATRVSFARRRGLAFIGRYDDPSDLDAAWWLAQEVMPAVHARDPTIECLLVGSHIPDELRGVSGPGIHLIGRAGELAQVFDRVRMTVAPLNFGVGMRGVVLDSLAAGVPCACTPVAGEGLDLSGMLGALVADGVPAMAELILRLHGDQAFNASCAEAGLAFIAREMSDAKLDERMEEALGLRTRSADGSA